jgi:sterol desaturase/sphingolipid hydroxylase (fatty acid hydroxylase superfamily)
MFSFFNPLNFNDPVGYAIPVFLLLIAMEIFVLRQKMLDPYEARDTFASLSLGIGSVVINLFTVAFYVGVYFWLYQFRIFKNLGAKDLGEFASWSWHKVHWWVWLIIIFADDFTFYWHHRLSHEVRILWAAHINHHDSQKYNLGTALRQSWTELLYKFIWWMWMPLIGFHPLMIMTMMHLNLIYQFWIHTEAIGKMGWFEGIFNTPSQHRVHHGSDVEYLDKNYAGIFNIWDRIFGSFQAESRRPKYGITKNIETHNPFKITAHEWKNIWYDVKRADKLKDKFNYIFNAPGWSHDGEDHRASTLQKKLKRQAES